MARENVERLRAAFDSFLAGRSGWGAELWTPKSSGTPPTRRYPLGKYAQLYTFKDGLIVHWKLYESQSEALEAAGLSGEHAQADSS